MSLRASLLFALVVAAGCAVPRGPVIQPTGSSSRGAYDNEVMCSALAEACADVVSHVLASGLVTSGTALVGTFAVGPASEGAWTLMAASDAADAFRRKGRAVRLVDKDVAASCSGMVVVLKTTYVAVDAEETRIPLSKWSLLSHADVNALLAATVASVALATRFAEDLGTRRGGCASVTAYVIDNDTKRTLLVLTGTDARGRRR